MAVRMCRHPRRPFGGPSTRPLSRARGERREDRVVRSLDLLSHEFGWENMVHAFDMDNIVLSFFYAKMLCPSHACQINGALVEKVRIFHFQFYE